MWHAVLCQARCAHLQYTVVFALVRLSVKLSFILTCAISSNVVANLAFHGT